MSISISFFLAGKSKYKDAKTLSICGLVRYSFTDNHGKQNRNFKFAVGESVPVKKFKNGMVEPRAENASRINATLASYKKDAIKLYEKYKDKKEFPTHLAFKKMLLGEITEVSENRDFLSDFAEFMEYHVNKGSTVSMQRTLQGTLNKLTDFSKKQKYHLDYSTINLTFYGKFKAYCKGLTLTDGSVGLSRNTFGSHINRLKMFLNHAKAEGWNKFEYYKHDSFEVLKEDLKVVSLTEEEVQLIASLDLTNRQKDSNGVNRLELSRDFFLLGCETGLRYSDYSKINKRSIKEVTNGYNLELRTQKTDKDVVIPLSQLAMDILLKYDFNLPKAPSNQKLNDNLKTIVKLAEIDKPISTHSARRTFCSIQYEAKMPISQIMAISSHTTQSSFFKYIGVDLTKNAEKVREDFDKFKVTKRGLLNTNLKIA
jgi:integrase